MKKWYRVRFERFNFDYKPSLQNSVDLVFSTDIPCDDDHLEKFERFVWSELWRQHKDWHNHKGPIKGRSGWSSANMGTVETVI